jgi:hypothetical protein
MDGPDQPPRLDEVVEEEFGASFMTGYAFDRKRRSRPNA